MSPTLRLFLLLAGVLTTFPSFAADRIVRPAVKRADYNEARLKELGIAKWESPRLRLFTDVPADKAARLPKLVDQVYDVWSRYFGPLPPAKDGAEFQITGYLMRDRDRFRAAKMIRDDLPEFEHGRHLGLEFWANDQDIDYYREHLLLHEATHCYMTAMPGGDLPLWYHEGMAELFGVHQTDAAGKTTFALFPSSTKGFEGFGRIRVLQGEIAAGRALTAAEVSSLGVREFSSVGGQPYAWSWAFCEFLDKHPGYRDRFHALARTIFDPKFMERWSAEFGSDTAMAAEWELFIRGLEPGYDFDRSAIKFDRGIPLARSTEVKIRADSGWQSAGLRLEPGKSYVVSAKGNVTLGRSTKPWISDPNGISLRYSGGQPIGTLMGAIVGDLKQIGGAGGLLHPLVIASDTVVEPQAAGTLYLRVNDSWSSLADNSGTYAVIVQPEAKR